MKERFTAIPYRRGQIFKRCSVRTGDKFKFFSYKIIGTQASHLNLARLLGVYDSELAKCEQYDSVGAHEYGAPPWAPYQQTAMMRAHLYKTSLGSFAVADRGLSIVCGFRNKKDYFRYALKFGDTTHLRFWYSNDSFWVFIDEQDPLSFTFRNPADWKNSDPMAGWL